MLKALNPIKKDEQIFISYINNTERRATRQSSLQEGYFFTCNCAKCSRNLSPYALWNSHHENFPTSLDSLFHFEQDVLSPAAAAQNDAEKIAAASLTVQVYTNVDRLLNDEVNATADNNHRLQAITKALSTLRVSWQTETFANPPYPTILNRLYLYQLDNQNFPAALSLLIFIHLNCNIYTYPQLHHPSNIAHLLAMAELCIELSLQDQDPAPAPNQTQIQAPTPQHPPKTTPYPPLDVLTAAQLLLILLRRLVPLSHGPKSGPMDTVKRLMAMVEEGQRGEGRAGEALTRWGNGGARTALVGGVLGQLRVFGGKGVVGEMVGLGRDGGAGEGGLRLV